jgi:hypothetical protein
VCCLTEAVHSRPRGCDVHLERIEARQQAPETVRKQRREQSYGRTPDAKKSRQRKTNEEDGIPRGAPELITARCRVDWRLRLIIFDSRVLDHVFLRRRSPTAHLFAILKPQKAGARLPKKNVRGGLLGAWSTTCSSLLAFIEERLIQRLTRAE